MDTQKILLDIKKSGLRITDTRRTIIEELQLAKKPLSVTEFLALIHVNKTTIYREMETLIKYKFVNDIDLGDGNKRYELSSLEHHHHLVCVKCQSIEDIQVKVNLMAEEKRISIKQQFMILKHNLEFFGVCHNCQ